MKQYTQRILSVAIISHCMLLLFSCTVGPDYVRPEITLPDQYRTQVQMTPHADTTASQPWWARYQDSMLSNLVNQALRNHIDLRIAAAKVQEAMAVLAQRDAGRFPQVDLGATTSRSRMSTLTSQPLFDDTPVISNDHRVSISTAFEIDFWGKARRAKEAARASLWSSQYAREVLALTLASTTVQTYYELRAVDLEIAIIANSLTTLAETETIIASRVRGGLDTQLDQNQIQIEIANTEIEHRQLQRQRSLLEHQLGQLTGDLSLQLPADYAFNLPAAITPPPELPAVLVQQRPDIQQAEQDLINANAQVGFYKAAQFPTFSLTSHYGGQSAALENLFDSQARIWSIAPSLSLPLFDLGRTKARTQAAQAVQRQALALYQKTIETAFQEVSAALLQLAYAQDVVAQLHTKTQATREALRLSRLRFEAGYSNYLEVLQAQRTTQATQQQRLRNQLLLITQSVAVIKSIGGDWAVAPATNPASPLSQNSELSN